MTFHIIYLAAGYGNRYGSNKLTEIFMGKELYRQVLDRLIEIEHEDRIPMDITVVTQYPKIVKALESEHVTCAVNPDPSRGISSSLIVGIESLQKQKIIGAEDYLVFFVADQPYLQKDTIENFLMDVEYEKQPMACIGSDGEYGNPVAFYVTCIPDLLKLTGDKGGKVLLKKAKPEDVFTFDDVDPMELRDIDRPVK